MKKIIVALMVLVSVSAKGSDYGAPPTATTYLTALMAMFTLVSPTYLSACIAGSPACDQLKIVVGAQEDAAYFVATDGNVVSAKLSQAFDVIREMAPGAKDATEMDLAKAILAIPQ